MQHIRLACRACVSPRLATSPRKLSSPQATPPPEPLTGERSPSHPSRLALARSCSAVASASVRMGRGAAQEGRRVFTAAAWQQRLDAVDVRKVRALR